MRTKKSTSFVRDRSGRRPEGFSFAKVEIECLFRVHIFKQLFLLILVSSGGIFTSI